MKSFQAVTWAASTGNSFLIFFKTLSPIYLPVPHDICGIVLEFLFTLEVPMSGQIIIIKKKSKNAINIFTQDY